MTMKLLANEKNIHRLEDVFQILFLIYVSLGCSSLTNGQSIVSLFMWMSYGLGALLLCIRLWNWKQYIRMPGLLCLLAMCVICGISTLVNFQYDLKRNITYLIFWVFSFFLFYAQSDKTAVSRVKKQFAVMAHLLSAIAFVLTAISLAMLVTLYSEVVTVNGAELTRGFVYGRLYGAYRTPNVGAVIACIVIMVSIHFIRKYKNGCYTAFAVVNILAQFFYIVFSDSRSGQVALALSGAVYTLFTAAFSPKVKKGAAKAAVVLLLTAATGLGAFFAPKMVQTAYNSILTHTAQQDHQAATDATDPSDPEETTEPTQPDAAPEDWMVDRGYDLSGDISNRRFDIWKSGLEIFMAEPWLGTSFAGFLPYAQEHLPETYIVSNDYKQMNTLDNDFMNLLVSNGIFAFVAFVAFVAMVLIYLFRGLAKMKQPDQDIPIMMSVCIASASFSMFASGVLYLHEPFSVIFWLALGALTVILSNSKKEGK